MGREDGKMEWLTDEVLFYGGLAVAISSLVMAVLFAVALRMNMTRLNALFDREYGEKHK